MESRHPESGSPRWVRGRGRKAWGSVATHPPRSQPLSSAPHVRGWGPRSAAALNPRPFRKIPSEDPDPPSLPQLFTPSPRQKNSLPARAVEALDTSITSGHFVDTKIYLFSHRNSSGFVCKPKALYANSTVLKSVPYFNDRTFLRLRLACMR